MVPESTEESPMTNKAGARGGAGVGMARPADGDIEESKEADIEGLFASDGAMCSS